MEQQTVSADICRLVNKELTRRLIKLHAHGYDLDFCMINCDCLACLQDQERFSTEAVTVRVVDQIFDFMTNCYQYLHTVETVCGKKGIMMMNGLYCYRVRKAAFL